MPRNSSGVNQLPAGTLATPNTVIQSSTFNAFAQDVSNELTASLPRDGRAGMTGSLKLASGALALGGVSFTESPATGIWYDPARSAVIFSVAGTEIAVLSTAGIAAQGIMRPGTLFCFAGPTTPLGTLLAYGQAVSRSVYSALFAAIGTVYGGGDGSTTFNLPDCRGVTLAGLDNMGGTDAQRLVSAGGGRVALGALVGDDDVTLQNAHLPVNLPKPTANVGYPPHSYGRSNDSNLNFFNGQSSGGIVSANKGLQQADTTPPAPAAVNITLTNPGGGQPILNVQPTRLVNICIQA